MICASPSELITMKCPSSYEEFRAPCSNMEKDFSAAATASKQILKTKTSPLKEQIPASPLKGHIPASPLKEHIPAKPQFTPLGVTTELFPLDNSGPVNNKENKNSHKGEQFLLDEVLQDSGYLSLHDSRNDVEHGSEEQHSTPTKLRQEKSRAPLTRSPSKCKGALVLSGTVFTSTPKMCHWKTRSQTNLNLQPVVKFGQAACEALEKSYQENNRQWHDWSVVDKVAEDHLLDRVIGRQMGREYVDVFSSLLSRNMRVMLTNVLALLGDMDLISCRKVSRSWRKIINEDTAALNRCQRALAVLKESRNSIGQENWCILNRDARVVFSSMQLRASSSTPSSSTPNYKAGRRTPNESRHSEYVQAASGLKQHESLRACIRCGSPSKHLVEAQKATCTRASCGFEFCTCCQEPFHGSTPCRTVTPRIARHSKMSAILPGSARSKRNVRRL